MNQSIYLVFLFVIGIHFSPVLSSCPNNITAIYAFGDGFFDTGNNNDRPTICFANKKPYGASFPDHTATGRFSDAEVPADLLSNYLGLHKLLRAYSDHGITAQDLLRGASFASACSGMDDLTATETNVLSLTKQFGYFQLAVERMKHQVGQDQAAKVVQGALYLISGGAHDLLNNFYVLPIRKILPLSAYIHLLLGNLEVHIKRIHSMGAMKIAVAGMPPIGCLPVDVTLHGTIFFERKCVDLHNQDAQAYNNKLKDRLQDIQLSLPGTKIVYIDIYSPIMDMVKNPHHYGMKVTLEGCCATGSLEVGPFCSLLGIACDRPKEYVFWDAIHPTQAAYRIITKHIQEKALPGLLF